MSLDFSEYHIVKGDTKELVTKLNAMMDAIASGVNVPLAEIYEVLAEVQALNLSSAGYAEDALQSANVAQAAALSATDSTARIAAVLKTRGITNVKAIAFKSAEGWEQTGSQSYKTETRPTGRFLGDYGSAAAAWAANVDGVPTVSGDYYFDNVSRMKKCTTSNSASVIYRTGSDYLPLECVFVATTAGDIHIVDLTDPLMPIWATIRAGTTITAMRYLGGTLCVGTSASGVIEVDFRLAEMRRHNTLGLLVYKSFTYWKDWASIGWKVARTSSDYYIQGNSINSVSMWKGYIAYDTGNGFGVITPDASVLKSSSTSRFFSLEILAGTLFSILDSSPDIVVGYGRVDKLTASFGATMSWTNVTTPSLSATSFIGLKGAENSLCVMSTSTFDILWPNPADYQSSLIARRGTTFATPPMKKPEVMLICSTVEGTASDAALVTGDNSTFTTTTGSWVPRTAGALSVVSGKLRITNVNATNDYADLSVSGLLAGRRYDVSVDYTKVASTDGRMTIASGGSGTTLFSGSGTYTLSFVATATTAAIRLNNLTGVISEYHEYDNVTMVMQAENLSGLANHGTIHGTLTAAAEVTGGVAGLSGFTVNTNYISAPNPWDGVSTGDAYIQGAFKCDPNTTTECVFDISYHNGSIYLDSRFYLIVESSGTVKMVASADAGATSVSVTSTSTYDDSLVHRFTARKTASHYILVIDDQEIGRVAVGSHGDLTFNAGAELLIGRTASGTTVAAKITGFCIAAGQSALSDAEVSLMHKHMRNLINGKAALDEIPTTATYNEQEGSVELLGTTYRQRVKDGAIISSAAHGVGSTPVVAAGARGEVAFGGSTGCTVSVPERNLREYQARKTTERFTVTYTGDSSRTTFPDPTDDDEMLVTRGAKPVNVWDDANHLTEGASDDYTVDDYGLGAYVAEIAVAPGANPVVIEFEREVWK